MKILIVSYFFPPYNTIGAVRVGKIAKYLYKFGHDVKVLTANDQSLPKNLKIEIPEENIISTDWLNINKVPELIYGGKEKIAEQGYELNKNNKMILKLSNLFKSIFNYPDGCVGWTSYAMNKANELLGKWKPDIIYASSMPHTSLIIGYRLSKKFNIPWIAELRDLWVDNHNYEYPLLRKIIEEKLERKVLSNTNGIVTVSQPLADKLKNKYKKSVEVIINGYDYEEDIVQESIKSKKEDEILRIVYTGRVYDGKQDPTPLFKALNLMGEELKNIKVIFLGRYLSGVKELAKNYKIENNIEVRGAIPYSGALIEQLNADILLHLLWNDPTEKGVYTGKLFEYIGARRPILAVGINCGVAVDLINERGLGVVTNDHIEIAKQLKKWFKIKKQNGVIQPLPPSVLNGLSREEQTRKLEKYIEDLIK